MLDEMERERIRAAVAAAEAVSGAEVVPVLVAASDAHLVADWRGAALGAWIGSAALVAIRWRDPWSGGAHWWPLAAALLGALGGFVVARVPALRRRLAGASALDRAVETGARSAFVEHAVFRTRDATGILLYPLSVLGLVLWFRHELWMAAAVWACSPSATAAPRSSDSGWADLGCPGTRERV